MPNLLYVAGTESTYKQPGANPAGFWAGSWHGFIAPFAFIFSLWNHSVSIYETNNNGRWYELGFLLGLSTYGSIPQFKQIVRSLR
jgi:hypothetical protein